MRKRRKTIQFDARLARDDGKDLLRVRLTNGGKEPIVVDGELLWGLSLRLIDDRGDGVPIKPLPHEFPPVGPWTTKRWKERTVTLQPGQSVDRMIDLYGGYESHHFLLSFPHGARGRPVGMRSMHRIDRQELEKQGRHLRYIWMDYNFSLDSLWQLKAFTGLVEPVDVLYRGKAGQGLDLETGEMFGLEEYLEILPTPSHLYESMRLDLKMDREDGKDLLRVRLTNVGKEPIVVDGKLVFGLSIHGIDNHDVWVAAEELPLKLPSHRPWTTKRWKERMTTLQPGQSIARVVDLYGGYRYLDVSYYRHCAPRRLPEGVRQVVEKQERHLRSIHVEYEVDGVTLRVLKGFTGLVEPVEGLSRGYADRELNLETGKMDGWKTLD
jgi:hypothetical protein